MSDERSSTRPADGDAEHDAWLREALRHAPDAAAAPPALLRDAILSQARAAVAPPVAARPVSASSSASILDTIGAFWSWLARPPVAAAFASVMAATLVGVMWWDRPLDEAMPPPSSPPAAIVGGTMVKPEASTALSQPSAPLAEIARAPAAAPPRARAATAAPAPAPAPAPTIAQAPAESPARDAATTMSRQAARPEPQSLAKVAPLAERRRDEAEPFAAQPKTEPAAADTQARTDKAADAVADASMKKQGAGRAADEKRSPSPAMSMAPPPIVAAPNPMPVPGQAPAATLGAARDVAQPLLPLWLALAAEGGPKSRRDAEARPSTVDAAVQHMLVELEFTASGRWVSVDGGAPRNGSGTSVRIGGADAATVWLDGNTVTLETRVGGSASSWRAVVSPAAVERLRAALARMPR